MQWPSLRSGQQLEGFFTQYPTFYETSKTRATPNRLNNRYKVLIEQNLDMIKDKTILDIASHDGRWTFAALKAGAKSVVGVELEQHLVEKARANMQAYSIPEARYSFIQSDIDDAITKFAPGAFDTIFCFGFMYHTMSHMFLFKQFERLKPKHLIIDTYVSPLKERVIELREIYETADGDKWGEGDRPFIEGHMSRPALELLLHNTGFIYRYADWRSMGITNWFDMRNYRIGKRVTVIATPG